MRALRLLLFTLLLGSVVFAQQPTPPSTGGGGGQPGGGAGSPTRPTTPDSTRPPSQPQQPQFPQDGRDPFGQGKRGLGGKIVPAPGSRLRVDIYLDGIRLDTAYTDMDGTFRFERLQAGPRRYELRIEVGPGIEYVEEVDFGFNFPVMVHIRNQGLRRTEFADAKDEGAGGTVISLASLSVPKNAAKEFDKGRELGLKKKYDEALARLRKATELYPKYAEAFNEIGLVYRRQSQNDEAQKAFEAAIAADPNWVGSYLNLATLQLAANQPQQLLETTQKIIKLNPNLGPAYFFQSVANFSMGRLAEAEQSALIADRKEHAQVPQVHLLLARIYQFKGDRAEQSKQLKAFIKESPNAPNIEKIRAELEQLKEK